MSLDEMMTGHPDPYRIATLLRLSAVLLFAGLPVHADEFDVFAVYGEAEPLNDEWQTCAASFVKPRLRELKTPETLAREALDYCRPMEDRLSGFFIAKIGRKSAEGVMALLNEKYRSGLIEAITEVRTRE